MRTFLLWRLAQTVLVVFLSLTAVFFLVRLGGDPVLLFLPMDGHPGQGRERVPAAAGLQ